MAERFGSFEVVQELTHDAASRRFLVRSRNVDGPSRALLRVLTASSAEAEALVGRARLALRIEHPGFVRILEVGGRGGGGEGAGVGGAGRSGGPSDERSREGFVVSELVDGVALPELRPLLESSGEQLPLRASLDIAIDLLRALDVLHHLELGGGRRGLVHGALRPESVQISRDGKVKLDLLGSEIDDGCYRAPECVTARAPDPAQDVFSVGLILVELAASARVGSPGKPIVALGLSRRIRHILEPLPSLTPSFLASALEMTSADPLKRTRTALDAVDRLSKVADELPRHEALFEVLGRIEQHRIRSLEAEYSEVVHADGFRELSDGDREACEPLFADLSSSSSGHPSDDAAEPSHQAESKSESRSESESESESDVAALDAFARSGPERSAKTRASDSSDAVVGRGPLPLVLPLPLPGAGLVSTVPSVPLHPRLAGGPRGDAVSPRGAASGSRTAGIVALQIGVAVLAAIGAWYLVGGLIRRGDRTSKTTDVPIAASASPTRGAPVGGEVQIPWKLRVESTPAGAEVFLSEVTTGLTTPQTIDVPDSSRSVRVHVDLEGFVPSEERTVPRPVDGRPATTHFSLERGKVFRVETHPPGALVSVDGRPVGVSPRTLRALPFGTTARIRASLSGYFPATTEVIARETERPLVSLSLKKGVEINVRSRPPHAEVFVEGILMGQTPIERLLVPAEGAFEIKVVHYSAKPWKQRSSSASMAVRDLDITLAPLPLSALALNAAERGELGRIDREEKRAKSALARAKIAHRAAERRVASFAHVKSLSLRALEDAETKVETTRRQVEDIEAEQQAFLHAREDLRKAVLARLESERPAEDDR